MENLTLTIRKNDSVKVVEANTFDIYFGTIDKLMCILDIDENTTSFQLLRKVTVVWKELTKILNEIFPDMEQEDWDYVRINDLVPVIMQVIRYTFYEIMGIPSDSKN